jgi:hypothetical protein
MPARSTPFVYEMTKLLIVVVAAGFVATCGPSERSPQDTVNNIYAAAQIAVSERLREPDSAKWHGANFAYVLGAQPGIAVCGRVSGRNGFGGYGGAARYLAIVHPGNAGSQTDAYVSGDRGFNRAWRRVCDHAVTEADFLKTWHTTTNATSAHAMHGSQS